MKKPSILFVCLGNICRSPVAEGVFREYHSELFSEIDSAGTASYHVGEAPHPSMTRVANRNGVNIASLRARQVNAEDFKRFDFIVAMDGSNCHELERMQKSLDGSTATLFLYRDSSDVPDPYYGGPEGFQNVFDIVRSESKNLVERLGLGS